MAQKKHVVHKKQAKQKGASSLLLLAGFGILGLALAFLLFGSSLFAPPPARSSGPVLPQVPNLENQPVSVAGDGRPIQVGQVAYDFAAQDLDGNMVRLSDLRGKTVMVNFWATWCPPCRVELPDFEAAYQKYADDGLVILALNQDEPASMVASFFYDLHGFTFTPLLDVGSTISRGYGVNSYPTTIFIDQAGVVTAVHRGLLLPEQLETYLAQTLPQG